MGFMMSHHEEKMGQLFSLGSMITISNILSLRSANLVESSQFQTFLLRSANLVECLQSQTFSLRSANLVECLRSQTFQLRSANVVEYSQSGTFSVRSANLVARSLSVSFKVGIRRRTVGVAFHREFVYCFPKFYIRINAVDNSFQKRR